MRVWWTLMVVSAVAACDGGTDGTDTDTDGGDRVQAILALEGDVAAGETVYTNNCVICHGADGKGGVGDDLTEASGETGEDAEFAELILNGEGEMTAFGDDLTNQQIADVLAYVHGGLFE